MRKAHRLLPPADFIEARGLVYVLIGGTVPVWQRAAGRTVLSMTIDPAPIFRATGSIADNMVAGAGFSICLLRMRLPPVGKLRAAPGASWRRHRGQRSSSGIRTDCPMSQRPSHCK